MVKYGSIFTIREGFTNIVQMYYYERNNTLKGSVTQTHNPKAAGSNPAPATKLHHCAIGLTLKKDGAGGDVRKYVKSIVNVKLNEPVAQTFW